MTKWNSKKEELMIKIEEALSQIGKNLELIKLINKKNEKIGNEMSELLKILKGKHG